MLPSPASSPISRRSSSSLSSVAGPLCPVLEAEEDVGYHRAQPHPPVLGQAAPVSSYMGQYNRGYTYASSSSSSLSADPVPGMDGTTHSPQERNIDLPLTPPGSRPISPLGSGMGTIRAPKGKGKQTSAHESSQDHHAFTHAPPPPAASQSYRSDGSYLSSGPTSPIRSRASASQSSYSSPHLLSPLRTEDLTSSSTAIASSSSLHPPSSPSSRQPPRSNGQAGRGQHPSNRKGSGSPRPQSGWVIDVERIDSGMEEWACGSSGMGAGRVMLVLGDAPRQSITHLLHSPHLRDTLLILAKPTASINASPISPSSSSSNLAPGAGSRNGSGVGGGLGTATGAGRDAARKGNRPMSKLRLSSSTVWREGSSTGAKQEEGSSVVASGYDADISSGGQAASAGQVDEVVYPAVQHIAGTSLERSIRMVLDEAASLAKAWRAAQRTITDPSSTSRRLHPQSHSRRPSTDSATSYTTSSRDFSMAQAGHGYENEILTAPRPQYANSTSSDASSVTSSRRSSIVSEIGGRLSLVGVGVGSGRKNGGDEVGLGRKKVGSGPVFDAIVAFVSGGQGQGQGQVAHQAMLHDALVLAAAAVPMLNGGPPDTTDLDLEDSTLPARLIQVVPHQAPERLTAVLDSYLASLVRANNPGNGRSNRLEGYLIHQRVLDKPIQRQGDSERSSPFDLLLSGALLHSAGQGEPSLYLDSFRNCRFVTGGTSATPSPDMDRDHPIMGKSFPATMSREGSVSDSLSIPGLSSDRDSASSGEPRPTTPTTPRAASSFSAEGWASVEPKQAVKTDAKKSGWISKVFRRRQSVGRAGE